MYRGRIIQQFKAVYSILNLKKMLTNENILWDEPNVHSDSSQDGVMEHSEDREVSCICQVRQPKIENFDNKSAVGNESEGVLILVHHKEDFENKGLITDDGRFNIKLGDRVDRIVNKDDDSVALQFGKEKFYVDDISYGGWGISVVKPMQNLIMVKIKTRINFKRDD